VTNPLDESVPMLWVNSVPGVEDARFGHIQREISPGPSTESDYTNLIYASDGNVTDTQTATMVEEDGYEKAFFNDNFVVFAGGSGAEPASGELNDAALVMHTIHDPTPDQGSGGDSPLYGYAKCQWLRHARGELPGDPCSAMWGGSTVKGTVFQAAAGTMECGRLLAINSVSLDASQAVSTGRCPRGSDVDTANYIPGWTRRLLIGGCMIPTDPQYNSGAEVHVPQACYAPADYMKGCLFPTALNFDPDALQSGYCEWPTKGCTDPTAYNYNSLATEDGPCIAKVAGCSIYQGLHTGMVDEGKFVDGGPYSDKFAGGLPLGQLPLGIWEATTVYNRSTLLPYEPAATDPADCVIAIEGCMDTAAANYDPQATVDTGDWCRARIPGCMDSQESANFLADRTVDGGCIGKALGCTDPAAVNYNPRATFNDGTCKAAVTGCGHPMALNYESAVTEHRRFDCVWYNSPPPSPPLPPLAPGSTTRPYSRVLVASVFDVEVPAVLAPCTRKGPGWSKGACWAEAVMFKVRGKRFRTSVSAGSAIVDVSVDFDTEAEADAAVAILNDPAQMADIELDGLPYPTSITAVRSSGGDVSSSAIELDSAQAGAIAGGVSGGVIFLLLVAAAAAWWVLKGRPSLKKKKRSSVTPGE
jgi:hypothetical protein